MIQDDQTWAAQAACATVEPDQLFGKGAEQRDARSLCFACPVRMECLAEALNSLYKAELIRNQGPWQDIDAARGRHRRVGPLVRAPPDPIPPSACAPPPSTKPPGHPTATARNNHNRQPPAPDKPASTKPGA